MPTRSGEPSNCQDLTGPNGEKPPADVPCAPIYTCAGYRTITDSTLAKSEECNGIGPSYAYQDADNVRCLSALNRGMGMSGDINTLFMFKMFTPDVEYFEGIIYKWFLLNPECMRALDPQTATYQQMQACYGQRAQDGGPDYPSDTICQLPCKLYTRLNVF